MWGCFEGDGGTKKAEINNMRVFLLLSIIF